MSFGTIPSPRPASPRFAHTAFERLRERCRALGLSAWRCDNSGLILREPEEPGPVGLMLQSPPFLGLIGAAARGWHAQEAPGVTELFPGCWALPIEEMHRRSRTGFTVLLAFGPECLEVPIIEKACAAAQLDPPALRRALRVRAHFSEQSCRGTRDLLLWMVQDLGAMAEHEQTSAGFTRQLTDSYETIDLLYALGRSMNDLTQPEKFITRLCDRVKFTLGFGWVSVWTASEHRAGYPPTPERLLAGGPIGVERSALEATVRGLLAAGSEGVRVVLTELEGRPIPGSGQVLLQPIMRSGRPLGAIMAGDKAGDDPQVSSYDIQLLEAAAGFIGAFMDNAALYADQQAMFLGTLEALTSSIDAKDRYTCGHSQRVAHLAHQLALAAGIDTDDADRVRIAGLVHDVGKIGVPEAVLCKAGRLTEEEFDAIKKHPEIGHRILRDIPQFDDVLPGVLHHHERIDGRGYPHGLAGEAIPLQGRLIAIADTFDAMSSTRSYRAAMPRAAVLAELQKCAGTQLDRTLVGLFVKLDLAEYDRMVGQHAAAAGALAKAA
jgi:HD-GYP domain-containing protein (c-di-GMP phosphodiesterase class II)